ncbi:hypothetical protein L7F22_038889 [Adiantum nelumboides]|nr:hypothetical protein [Adiantum nelumboides]
MDDLEFEDDFDESAFRLVDQIESDFVRQKNNHSLANNQPSTSSLTVNTAQRNDAARKNGSPNSTSFDLSYDIDFDEVCKTVEAAEKQHQTVQPQPQPMMTKPLVLGTALKRKSDLSHENTRGGHKQVQPLPSTSRNISNGKSATSRPSGSNMRQLNLFGDVIPPQPSQGVLIQANRANSAIAPASQSSAAQKAQDDMRRLLLGPHANSSNTNGSQYYGKTKQWDFSQPMVRAKRPFKVDPDDFDFDEFADADLDQAFGDIDNEFDLPPPPVEPDVEGLKQMKVKIDREAAKTWVYPTNKERRDYQFNIVQRALFNNVLVALPTGLGKTFIAAVVILNYYRWFPDGKIIFVAPTKPLVAQQQVACHGICGLPWDAAIEMTGETKASLRAEEWQSKRIFYMTPQTFENDLCSTAINAEDVVCVVVDEAHRATGNYAYGKVIRHLMVRNPFFRVLALTATPGSNSEKVQEVVDSLHINLIEIRQEDALDIRKYVHAKDEDPVVVPLRGVVAELRDHMCKLMMPHIDVLVGAGVLAQKDPVALSPFAIRSIPRDPRKRSVVNQRKLYPYIKDLGALAQAMDNLIKYSVSMFAEKILNLQGGTTSAGSSTSTKRQQIKYQANTIMNQMRQVYELSQDSEGFVPHPKMDYLQNVIASHFCSRRGEQRQFVWWDKSDGNRSKGQQRFATKDQERIIEDFKKGDYNVIVSTSIGEEGLDIGEVDLIVCYEAVKSAVRMLQRVGRTGRKREGRIVVLMSEGPEEKNWQQSKDQYKTIQHDIIRGINLSLYDDVERLVPPDITSEVRFEDVDQPPFDPSMIRNLTASKRKGTTAKKTKRNTDPMRNVPKGASMSFTKVSDMRKGKGKGKAGRVSMREGESSEDDVRQNLSNKAILHESSSSAEDSDAEMNQVLILDSPSPPRRANGPAQENTIDLLSSSSISKQRGRILGSGRPRLSPSIQPEAPTNSRMDEPSREPLNETNSNQIADSTLEEVSADPLTTLTKSSSPIVVRRRAKPHPLIARLAEETLDLTDPEDVSDSLPELIGLSSDEESDGVCDESPALNRQKKRTFVRKNVPVSDSSASNSRDTPFHKQMGPPAAPKSAAKPIKEKKSTVSKASKLKTGKRKIGGSPNSRRLFNMEADRSTDEEIHGEKDENDELDDRYQEDSSDREHVGDFMPTQAIKGYQQQAIYMQSLMSQNAPSIFGGNRRKSAGAIDKKGVIPQIRHHTFLGTDIK